MTLIDRIQALILARMKWIVLVVAMLTLGGFAPGASAAEGPCADCDLVIAERDLPDGYAYDADSPERDPKGQARSIQLAGCVRPTKLRREPRGVERQSVLFATADDPLGGDENVVRFKTAKQARAFASAFDDYLHDGPKCDVITARDDDGSVFELGRLGTVELGGIGDQGAAIVSHGPYEGAPDRYLAVVRTGRTVLLIEAFASEQIDEARFVQLVEDATTAAAGN